DGLNLLVSNLHDGVDKYSLPTMHCAQSFHHTILKNVLLQIAVAREAGWMVVGGNNGFARIFHYQTGAFWGQLEHWYAWRSGDLVVAVTAFESSHGCTIATGCTLEGHSSIKVWTHE
ncbi:hypothetical protein PAXRUDRAFT_103392, partial [Paxillus rubicundulus Ve08.2h10]